VTHFFESIGRRRTDLSGRAFRQDQLRKTRLDSLAALPQSVILGIADFKLILLMIEPIVVNDQLRQFPEF